MANPTMGQVISGVLCIGGVQAGITAGIGAGTAALFTTIHPGAGAVFGAVYGVVSLINIIAIKQICGTKFMTDHCVAIAAISVILSSAITVGLMALLFTAVGVAFTAGSLFILLGATVAISLALNSLSLCCEVKVPASSI